MHIYVMAVLEYPAKLCSFKSNGLHAYVGMLQNLGYTCRAPALKAWKTHGVVSIIMINLTRLRLTVFSL